MFPSSLSVRIQKQMAKVRRAINDHNFVVVKKLVGVGNYRYQNWCGQTLLHWAVLKCNHDVITWLCSHFADIIDITDNVSQVIQI